MSETLRSDSKDTQGDGSSSNKSTERKILGDNWQEVIAQIGERLGQHDEKGYLDHIASELLEVSSSIATKDFGIKYRHGKPEGVDVEVADLVILILGLANYYFLDLDEALEAKVKYILEDK